MLVRVKPLSEDERQQLTARSGGPKFQPSDAWIPVYAGRNKQLIHVRRDDVVSLETETED